MPIFSALNSTSSQKAIQSECMAHILFNYYCRKIALFATGYVLFVTGGKLQDTGYDFLFRSRMENYFTF
jgi:hypothetical protein